MRRHIRDWAIRMLYSAVAIAWCVFVSPCPAQEPCTPQWQATFGGRLNINSSILDFATFNDGKGAGPALYISGAFTTAGGALVNRIARWNPNQNRWDALAGGMDSGEVRAMIVFDDGNGPALFAGGSFSKSGGVTTNGIARWNGTSWTSVGGGVSHSGRSYSVNALALHDDGSGPALYAGGVFDQAGGENVQNVARWNGEFWSAAGAGPSSVNTLLSADLGDGLALYAGGQLNGLGEPDANYVARWDGQQWTAVGQSLGMDTEVVHDLILFDDGAGPALYAGGDFNLMKKTPAPHTIA